MMENITKTHNKRKKHMLAHLAMVPARYWAKVALHHTESFCHKWLAEIDRTRPWARRVKRKIKGKSPFPDPSPNPNCSTKL